MHPFPVFFLAAGTFLLGITSACFDEYPTRTQAIVASEIVLLREAAVSILTKQGTLAATEQLYNHIVERGETDGYYRSGMGIGQMKPQAEALGYLEQLVTKRDEYSHLTAKALLNYGQEGIDKLVTLLSTSDNADFDRNMLHGAQDHIPMDVATVRYMEQLARSSAQPALRELADRVLKEREIDVDNQHRQIEYNKNYEKGIVSDSTAARSVFGPGQAG